MRFRSFRPEGGSAAKGLESCLRGSIHADGVPLDPGVAQLARETGFLGKKRRRNRKVAHRVFGTLVSVASYRNPDCTRGTLVGLNPPEGETCRRWGKPDVRHPTTCEGTSTTRWPNRTRAVTRRASLTEGNHNKTPGAPHREKVAADATQRPQTPIHGASGSGITILNRAPPYQNICYDRYMYHKAQSAHNMIYRRPTSLVS